MERPASEQLDFLKALDGNPSAEPGGNPAKIGGYLAERLWGDRRNRARMGKRGCLVTSENGSPAPADRTRDETVRDG